jgi:hypothetical protein
MLLAPFILADRFISACLTSVPSVGSSMLTQHFEQIAKHSIYYLGRKLFCKIKDLPINIYPKMTNHFIQQQIAEFAHKYPSAVPKKEIAMEMPKVAMPAPAPKKSGVIQLQCTNFPKKDSESSEDSEYSDDSDDSDDSNDNIGSYSDSCACDEEGECDYYFIQRARVDYFSRNRASANISGKK